MRRSLAKVIVGRTIQSVHLRRRDVVHGPCSATALLKGCRLDHLERLGKQLALMSAPPGADTACICFHLGMTGSLCFLPSHQPIADSAKHCHIIWRLEGGGQLVFQDSRRFGGVWTFASPAQLWSCRWHQLGPDATRITPGELHKRLLHTRCAIKSVLLDQHIIAGLGNIYVDELLFTCRLHPRTPADCINILQIQRLIRHMRNLLKRSIAAGGSTLRNYVDGNGQSGRFQVNHKVYGRAGGSCVHCNGNLSMLKVSGRTTVFCSYCQK